MNGNSSVVCDEHKLKQTILIIESLDYFRVPFIIFISVLVLVSLTAVVGNGLVIVTILKRPNLQTPSYVLITTMAATDLLLALTLYPFYIARLFFRLQKNVDLICSTNRLYLMTGFFFIAVSFMMSILISIDRYLAIFLKHRYRSTVTKQRVLWAILLTWISMLLWALSMRYIDEIFLNWRLVSGIMGVLLLSIITGIYAKAFISLHRYTSQVHNQQPNTSQQTNFDASKYKKSLNTMVIILAWLIICCLPIVGAHCAFGNYEPTTISTTFAFISVVIFSINSCTNPVIYILRFTDISNGCRETVKRFNILS